MPRASLEAAKAKERERLATLPEVDVEAGSPDKATKSEVDVEAGSHDKAAKSTKHQRERTPRNHGLSRSQTTEPQGQAEKKPFSAWPCAWSPKDAKNPDIYEPFASLEVVIQRAFGLVAADVNTSDPYCKLMVNGAETGDSTTVVQATLAPMWNETFEVSIYHPLDVFSITVHDKDFGTSLGELDVLGLDDDFLGWVDIPIAKLPENRTLHGWVELCPESHFEDSVQGRRRKGRLHTHGAGHLQLKLRLKTVIPRGELFALMLPAPDYGDDLPKLDMVSLFDTYAELKDEIRSWKASLQHLYSKLPKDLWVDTACVVFLIWEPTFVPAIMAVGSAYLSWKHWLEALREKLEISNASSSLLRLMLRSAGELWSKLRRRDFQKPAAEGMSQPLLAADADIYYEASSKTHAQHPALEQLHSKMVMPPVLRAAAAARVILSESAQLRQSLRKKTDNELKEDETTHELGRNLSNLTPFMSGKDKKETRRIQKALARVTDTVETMNDFVEEETHILLCALSLTVLAIVLGILHKWTPWAVQWILTLATCAYFLKGTIIGRFIFAYQQSRQMSHGRQRLLFELGLCIDKEGNSKVHKHISRHLTALDTLPFEPTNSVLQQKGHAHEIVQKTYVEPTWCHGCGGFLWGVTHQGLQCCWCCRNFCQACSAVACDSVSGPRSCDVVRPEGWNETTSVSAATASNMSTVPGGQRLPGRFGGERVQNER